MASCDGILGTGRSAPSRRGVPGTQRRDEKSVRLQRAPSRRSASRWEGEGSGVIPRPTESRRKAQGVAWRPSIITSLQGLRPGASRPLALHDGEELRSCAGVLAEYSARRRRHHLTARLLDPPHGHTEMLRFDHHASTGGLEPTLAEKLNNLRRESFLHLRPPRQDFHEPRHLADAEDASLRNVPDVGDAMEREEMVLAVVREYARDRECRVWIAGKCVDCVRLGAIRETHFDLLHAYPPAVPQVVGLRRRYEAAAAVPTRSVPAVRHRQSHRPVTRWAWPRTHDGCQFPEESAVAGDDHSARLRKDVPVAIDVSVTETLGHLPAPKHTPRQMKPLRLLCSTIATEPLEHQSGKMA